MTKIYPYNRPLAAQAANLFLLAERQDTQGRWWCVHDSSLLTYGLRDGDPGKLAVVSGARMDIYALMHTLPARWPDDISDYAATRLRQMLGSPNYIEKKICWTPIWAKGQGPNLRPFFKRAAEVQNEQGLKSVLNEAPHDDHFPAIFASAKMTSGHDAIDDAARHAAFKDLDETSARVLAFHRRQNF